MKEKDLKIFIGPTEIANIGAILGDAFRNRGIKVTVVSIGLRPFQDGQNYDKVLAPNILHLNKVQKLFKYIYCWLYCFFRYFPTHNVFIFQFGDTLLPFNLDLPLYRLFRKITIMRFVGSDIRYQQAVKAVVEKVGLKFEVSEERLRMEQSADSTGLRQKRRMIYKKNKFWR